MRVVHASPDAPVVDVLVNDELAFDGVTFVSYTDYADLAAGTCNVRVVPAGATEPVVIEADLDLEAGTDYTVAATGLLAGDPALAPVPSVDASFSVPAAESTAIYLLFTVRGIH